MEGGNSSPTKSKTPGKHLEWVSKKREEQAKIADAKLERAAQLLFLKADQRVKEVAVHHHRHKTHLAQKENEFEECSKVLKSTVSQVSQLRRKRHNLASKKSNMKTSISDYRLKTKLLKQDCDRLLKNIKSTEAAISKTNDDYNALTTKAEVDKRSLKSLTSTIKKQVKRVVKDIDQLNEIKLSWETRQSTAIQQCDEAADWMLSCHSRWLSLWPLLHHSLASETATNSAIHGIADLESDLAELVALKSRAADIFELCKAFQPNEYNTKDSLINPLDDITRQLKDAIFQGENDIRILEKDVKQLESTKKRLKDLVSDLRIALDDDAQGSRAYLTALASLPIVTYSAHDASIRRSELEQGLLDLGVDAEAVTLFGRMGRGNGGGVGGGVGGGGSVMSVTDKLGRDDENEVNGSVADQTGDLGAIDSGGVGGGGGGGSVGLKNVGNGLSIDEELSMINKSELFYGGDSKFEASTISLPSMGASTSITRQADTMMMPQLKYLNHPPPSSSLDFDLYSAKEGNNAFSILNFDLPLSPQPLDTMAGSEYLRPQDIKSLLTWQWCRMIDIPENDRKMNWMQDAMSCHSIKKLFSDDKNGMHWNSSMEPSSHDNHNNHSKDQGHSMSHTRKSSNNTTKEKLSRSKAFLCALESRRIAREAQLASLGSILSIVSPPPNIVSTPRDLIDIAKKHCADANLHALLTLQLSLALGIDCSPPTAPQWVEKKMAQILPRVRQCETMARGWDRVEEQKGDIPKKDIDNIVSAVEFDAYRKSPTSSPSPSNSPPHSQDDRKGSSLSMFVANASKNKSMNLAAAALNEEHSSSSSSSSMALTSSSSFAHQETPSTSNALDSPHTRDHGRLILQVAQRVSGDLLNITIHYEVEKQVFRIRAVGVTTDGTDEYVFKINKTQLLNVVNNTKDKKEIDAKGIGNVYTARALVRAMSLLKLPDYFVLNLVQKIKAEGMIVACQSAQVPDVHGNDSTVKVLCLHNDQRVLSFISVCKSTLDPSLGNQKSFHIGTLVTARRGSGIGGGGGSRRRSSSLRLDEQDEDVSDEDDYADEDADGSGGVGGGGGGGYIEENRGSGRERYNGRSNMQSLTPIQPRHSQNDPSPPNYDTERSRSSVGGSVSPPPTSPLSPSSSPSASLSASPSASPTSPSLRGLGSFIQKMTST